MGVQLGPSRDTADTEMTVLTNLLISSLALSVMASNIVEMTDDVGRIQRNLLQEDVEDLEGLEEEEELVTTTTTRGTPSTLPSASASPAHPASSGLKTTPAP